jgi:hypothetical protein
MGAGILPIAIYNNKVYFLFGQEAYDKKWSDFGGARDYKTEPIFETAIREGYEELNGLLGTKSKTRRIVKNNYITKINKEDNTYSTYVFTIPYNNTLPELFGNYNKFMVTNFPEKINKKGFFEKSNIKWFSYEELKSNKYPFREHYKEIIKKLLQIKI